MNKLKKIILCLLLLQSFLSFTPALAQTQPSTLPVYNPGVDTQVAKYLCTPDISLFTCINQLYKFAIIVAAVVGVFFIVIAGYLYMSSGGSDESVKNAKDILTSTIASIVILMAGYILLKAINPDLIQFHTISPPGVTLPADNGLISSGGNNGGASSGMCQQATTGVAAVSSLSQTCFGSNASNASMIANKETGGNSTLGSSVDKCRDQNGNIIQVNGQDVSASWGLFQINITANQIVTPSGTLNCPSAFSAVYTAKNHTCYVTNTALYQQCVTAAKDANSNILTACKLSNNGQNWKSWANECGF